MFAPPLLACCSLVLTSCAAQNICVITVFTYFFLFVLLSMFFTSCFVSQHVLCSCNLLSAVKFRTCFSPFLNQHLSFHPLLPRRYSLCYGFYPPEDSVFLPSRFNAFTPPLFVSSGLFLTIWIFGVWTFFFFFSSLFVFYLWSFLFVSQHIFDLSFSELFSCHRLGARSKTLFFMFSWHLTSTPLAKIYTVWVCALL